MKAIWEIIASLVSLNAFNIDSLNPVGSPEEAGGRRQEPWMILGPAWSMHAPAWRDTQHSNSCAALPARRCARISPTHRTGGVSNAGCCHAQASINDRRPCDGRGMRLGLTQVTYSSRLPAAPAAQDGAAAAGLAGLLQAIQAQMQQQAQGSAGEPPGADLEVQGLSYHPAGVLCAPQSPNGATTQRWCLSSCCAKRLILC